MIRGNAKSFQAGACPRQRPLPEGLLGGLDDARGQVHVYVVIVQCPGVCRGARLGQQNTDPSAHVLRGRRLSRGSRRKCTSFTNGKSVNVSVNVSKPGPGNRTEGDMGRARRRGTGQEETWKGPGREQRCPRCRGHGVDAALARGCTRLQPRKYNPRPENAS